MNDLNNFYSGVTLYKEEVERQKDNRKALELAFKIFKEKNLSVDAELMNSYQPEDFEVWAVNLLSGTSTDLVSTIAKKFTVEKCLCEDCDKKTITLFNEKSFCKDCLEEEVHECYNCAKPFSNRENHNMVNSNTYCRSCFIQNSVTCDSCGERRLKRTKCKCKVIPNETKPNPPIFYNFFEPGKVLVNNRGAGIELEYSKFQIKNRRAFDEAKHNKFYITRDGSVNGNGVEVVSNVMKGSLFEKNLKNFMDTVKLGVDKTCGYHIHISTDDYNPTNIKDLFQTYQNLESIFYTLMPKSRSNNSYCCTFADTYGSERMTLFNGARDHFELECMFYKVKDKQKIDYEKRQSQRGGRRLKYAWCNFHSLFSHGNVEIRIHSGTGNYEKILHWISLQVAIVEYVKLFGVLSVSGDTGDNSMNTNYNLLKDLLKQLRTANLITKPTVKFYKSRFYKFSDEFDVDENNDIDDDDNDDDDGEEENMPY